MNINRDQIAEINRAATSGASEALSKLTGIPVTIETVHPEVKKFAELLQMVNPEASVVAIESPLTGDVRGKVILLMPIETALGLSDLLLRRGDRGASREITGEEEGVLNEVANIVIGNYLKKFAPALPGVTLLHGLSYLSSGRYGDLAPTMLPRLLPYEEEGLIIGVTFGFQQAILKGYVAFIFAGVKWTPLFETAVGGKSG